MMEYDIHTLLDFMTLAATGWVIYMLRGPLKEGYQAELDSLNPLFVAGPCLALALAAHPGTRHFWLFRIMWAFCVYLEAVSVLPQLRMMQARRAAAAVVGGCAGGPGSGGGVRFAGRARVERGRRAPVTRAAAGEENVAAASAQAAGSGTDLASWLDRWTNG